MNVPDKVTGGAAYEATEFNQFKNESQNAIEASGQTLSASDIEQLTKAMFANGVSAMAMQDGGSVNSIELSPVSGASGLKVPDSYDSLNGALFQFKKTTANTSTTVLVNAGQTGTELGAKTLYQKDGTTPVSIGQVTGLCVVQYLDSISAFILVDSEFNPPAVFDFEDQRVMETAPATKYPGTTWENVSERSCFYHLSASSGGAVSDIVTRDEVEHNNGSGVWSIDKEFAFADLVYDDVIGGTGTHAGKYVVQVDEFSGIFERLEGGSAEDFENGKQDHASQKRGGQIDASTGSSVSFFWGDATATGVFKADTTARSQASAGAVGIPGYDIIFDNSGQTGQTYNTSGDGLGNEGSDPGEHRPDCITKVRWRRTS